MALAVLGVGAVSALGQGAAALRQGLERPDEPEAELACVATAAGERILCVYRAECLGLERFVPPRALRRLDHLSRMALLASHLALEDAAVEIADRTRLGLAFGSAFGPQSASDAFNDSVMDGGDRCASPSAFAGSVHNALASQVSIALRIEGPCQTVTAFGQTLGGVLSWADAWLARGEVDYVLAGAGEEVTPFRAFCAASCGGRAALSEGFCAFLLGRPEDAAGRALVEVVSSGRCALDGACRLELPAGPWSVIHSHQGLVGEEAAVDFAHFAHASALPLPECLPPGAGFDLAMAVLELPGSGRTACFSADREGRYTLLVVAR